MHNMNIIQNFMLAGGCCGNLTIHVYWDVIAKLGKTDFNKCYFDTYIVEIAHELKKKKNY